MTEAIVGLSFDGIAEDIVGLFQRGELGSRPLVVVEVRMVFPNLRAEGLLDIVLGGIRRDLQEIIEILSHGRSPIGGVSVRT